MSNLLARGTARTFTLLGEVGNGRSNDPEDVMAVKRQLARRGRYALPADGPTGFIDRGMLDGIADFQRDEGLTVDGWLAPGGETERNLALPQGRPPGTPTPYFPPRNEVGNGRANDEEDVVGVKRALGALGLYRHDRTADPSPFIDTAMIDGIRTFQRDNGLKVDGWLAPGGETETALRDLLYRPGEPLNPRTMEIRPDEPATKAVLLANAVDTPDKAPASRRPSLLEESEAPVHQEKTEELEPPIQTAQAGPLIQLGVRYGPAIATEAAKRAAPYLPPVIAGAILGKEAVENKDVVDRYITDLFNEQRPLTSDRGGEDAVKGNDQGIRTCLAQLKENYPDIADRIKHIGGGTQDGLGDKKVKETYVPNAEAMAEGRDARPGSNNADWSFYDTTKRKDEPGAFAHVNTMTMMADGVTPIAREARQLESLVKNAIKDTVYGMPKKTKNMSEDDYQKIVDEHCAKMWAKYLGPPKNKKESEDQGEAEAGKETE